MLPFLIMAAMAAAQAEEQKKRQEAQAQTDAATQAAAQQFSGWTGAKPQAAKLTVPSSGTENLIGAGAATMAQYQAQQDTEKSDKIASLYGDYLKAATAKVQAGAPGAPPTAPTAPTAPQGAPQGAPPPGGGRQMPDMSGGRQMPQDLSAQDIDPETGMPRVSPWGVMKKGTYS